MRALRIYDLDGTLLSSEHRYKLKANGKIDLQHWRQNSTKSQIRKDSLLPLASQYRAHIKSRNDFVALGTARIVCSTTKQMIRETLGQPDFILGRESESDTRSGVFFKEQIIPIFNAYRFSSIHLYEDNLEYIAQMKAIHPCVICHYIPSKQGY